MMVPESRETGLEIEGEDILAEVRILNEAGERVIFAPNHLKPQGKLAALRTQSALADDFPKLKSILESHGIASRVVFRGDTDMKIGDSAVRRFVYDTHRKAMSAVGRFVADGIPMAINKDELAYATKVNFATMKELFTSADNLTIYPFGHWYDSGAQDFSADAAMESDGTFKKISTDPEWKDALKSGFVRVAIKAGAPVVPVYVEHAEDGWLFRFGEMIKAEGAQGPEELAERYLQRMQALKEGRALGK